MTKMHSLSSHIHSQSLVHFLFIHWQNLNSSAQVTETLSAKTEEDLS